MKIKNILVIIATIMVLSLPFSVKAVDCSSYDVSSCPNTCTVTDGACVKANVGDNVCYEPGVINSLRVVGYFILIAKIVVPIIIIAIGTMDIFKAIQKGDDGATLKKQLVTFGIRVLVGIVVFFIPLIIDTILLAIGEYSSSESDREPCVTCLLHPGDCNY